MKYVPTTDSDVYYNLEVLSGKLEKKYNDEELNYLLTELFDHLATAEAEYRKLKGQQKDIEDWDWGL